MLDVLHRLARDLAVQIGVNHMPEEMDQCAPALVSLYLARQFGPLPEGVEHAIGSIERAVAAEPHYTCTCCGALFADTDDLGLVTQEYVEHLRIGEIRPIGLCPVCSGAVHPKS